jgi:FkbM family methyltransferase
MSVLAHIRRNLKEARVFGPLFWTRHLGRLFGQHVMSFRVAGLGKIYLRPDNSDAATFNQVFVDRSYDLRPFGQNKRVMDTYARILASGRRPVIIDGGANVGAAALWFQAHFPEACIIAIEPNPPTAEICRLNASDHAAIQVVEAALGSSPGFVRLESTNESWATQTIREEGAGTTLMTIEEAQALAGPDSELFIVKIDIEGFEADLFGSNTKWLANTPVVMIEPHDWLFPGRRTSHSFRTAFATTAHEMLISGENLLFVL